MFRPLTATLATLALLLTLSTPWSPSAHAATVQWEPRGQTIPGLLAEDQTGWSVALSANGDTVAIGEPQAQATKPGRVRVFSLSAGVWDQVGADLVGEVNNDFFGRSVSLSSNGLTLAVGAPGFDITGTSGAGSVTVYRFDGTTWTVLGSPIRGTATTMATGTSVALGADGNRVAVGSPQGGTDSEGVVRVFDFTTAWAQVGASISGGVEFANSGASVALSDNGTRLAIGGFGNASNTGQVRVFSYTDPTWSLLGVALNGSATGDQFGTSVDLNGAGDTLVVGAPQNDAAGSNAGQVTIHRFDGSAWGPLGSAVNGRATGNQFGYSVAMSSAGSRVVAGARFGALPGVKAGEVLALELTGGSWVALGQTITGESAGDEAGHAVAISGQGSRIAIGAPKRATSTGQVRLFGYEEPVAATAVAPGGQPGIYLHLAGVEGGVLEGSPVYFGSYKVASASPYVLSLRTEGTSTTSVVLAEGVTDQRGTLEQRLTLRSLAPGTYTLSLTGTHVFGTGLRLTNTFSVDARGRFSRIGQNTHGIW